MRERSFTLSALLCTFLIALLLMVSGRGWGQNYQSFDASTTNAWTSAKWSSSSSTNACVSSGLTNSFTAGRIAYFCTVNGTGSGSVGITIGGIIATENYTHSSASGTLATGGTVVTIDIASGKIFDLSTASWSTATGTGFIKTGAGMLAEAGGTYTGGFTLNAGTVALRGTNGMGSGGSLTINGGTIAGTATRDLSGKYAGGITIGGDFTLGSSTSPASGSANLTFSNIMALGGVTRTITIGGTGTYYLNGVISNGGVIITNTAAGIISFGGANTYNGGTQVSGGTLQLGASGVLTDAGSFTLDGGTFKSGATTGYSEALGALTLSNNSTIAFGTGSHTITFAASNGITWNGTLLTITGWSGTAGSSGTAGKIFVGTDGTGLTSAQLAKISFSGYSSGAQILSNGEVVPLASTPLIALSSPSQVTASGISQGATNQSLSHFQAAVTTANATLNSLAFTSAGSYAAADMVNFKLYYATTDNFGSASQIGTSITTSLGTGSHTFSSLTQAINSGATGYFWITCDVNGSATAGNTINIAADPVLTFASGTPTGTISAGGSQTIQAVVPDIAISSPNPAVAAGNITQNTTNNVIYRFDNAITTANATMSGLQVTTAGTYLAADLTNLKVWYSSDATFNAGSDVLLSTKTTSLGAGTQVFSSWTNQLLSSGSTGYIFITTDIPCAATPGNTISVNAVTTSDVTFLSGNKTGTTNAGGTQTIILATPSNVSGAGASVANAQSVVSWTNPTDCYSEVMIVASLSTVSGTPTGDGSSYSADLTFGNGTAFGGGNVVYKGASSPQTVIGLAMGTLYYYKIFTRNGTNWSAGVEASATTIKAEPTNHPSGFTANTGSPTYSNIVVSWTDAAGGTVPENYLIKASSTSYAEIGVPVDGAPEGDGTLVKNIAQGVHTASFTGLNASTTYYFKIYPYTNTSTNINYKTDGQVQQATATTDVGPAYSTGDFGFTATSGSWGTTNANWKQWDGSGWNTTPSGVPTASDNVFILGSNICTVELSGKSCKNLNVESSAKLYTANATMGTPRYVNVSGNITCNGTIGNGVGVDDVLSFNITGGLTSTISGSGTFTANRIRRNNGAGILSMNCDMDIELRYNGLALYNATSSPDGTQTFNITVNSGKHLNLTGNGATPTAGYELKAVDKATIYGKLTVTGTLTNSAGASGLVIKSDASGTGSLIHSTASVAATVERYFSGAAESWHLLSSPVAAQAIAGDFTPSGSYPDGSGYDFYMWQESSGTWVNKKNTGTSPTWLEANGSNNFVVGRGYMTAYQATNPVKTFTGNLNNGLIYIPLTNSGSGTYGKTNLVGNPYPSSIDWKNVPGFDKSDLLVATGGGYNMYIYNQTASNYGAYNDLSVSDEGTNGTSRYIPPMQGFLVTAKTGTLGSGLGIDDDARVHSAQSWLKNGEASTLRLTVTAPQNYGSDEVLIEFGHPTNSGGAEKWFSMMNTAPSLYAVKDNGKYSIDFLTSVDDNSTVPVDFKSGVSGAYEINATFSQNFGYVTLEDRITGIKTDLRNNPLYSFSAATTDDPARFLLHFSGVGIQDPVSGIQDPISIHASGNTLVINGNSGEALRGDLIVCNMIGQVVMHQSLNQNLPACVILNGATGYYVVKIVTGKQVYSAKVFIQ